MTAGALMDENGPYYVEGHSDCGCFQAKRGPKGVYPNSYFWHVRKHSFLPQEAVDAAMREAGTTRMELEEPNSPQEGRIFSGLGNRYNGINWGPSLS